MSERAALRRRALRPTVVASATWAAAGAATVLPDARPPTVALAALSVIAALMFSRRRVAALGIAAVALACAAATVGAVASLAPVRDEVARLQVDGGRHLDLELTVTGRIDPTADGGAWFDAEATTVSAGAVHLAGSLPVRVGVDADGRRALSSAGMGSTVHLSGRTLPADRGERAMLVLRAGRIDDVAPPGGLWGWSRESATRWSPRRAAFLNPARVSYRGSPSETPRSSIPRSKPR